MTGKFRDGSQYQASSARIAKYLNRAGAKLEENTEKLQLDTINSAKLPVRGVEPRDLAQRDERLQENANKIRGILKYTC